MANAEVWMMDRTLRIVIEFSLKSDPWMLEGHWNNPIAPAIGRNDKHESRKKEMDSSRDDPLPTLIYPHRAMLAIIREIGAISTCAKMLIVCGSITFTGK
jgi:hypothetical protein